MVKVAAVHAAEFSEQAMALSTTTGEIHGSLILPEATGPVPLVLLFAGSGPSDRDANTVGYPGKHNALKLLAEALANAGYASVRFDMRGVAASLPAGPTEANLRFEMYVQDMRPG